MLPTLVFTLVLTSILRDQFGDQVPPFFYGALIVYTLVNTVIPGFLMKGVGTDYERHSHGNPPTPEPPAGPVAETHTTADAPPPASGTSSVR